ncbi:lipoprotein signal peptidase [Mobilicoccus pelagius NBRC 104925]|uniref:Lipoprotein signal peptidase n=1 Tax=Mobilicoccus pelagius NBRC 104925 TaxID=1089455 RepID=H5UQF5_9MICO|nr:lipoprotein signal peptidase [Mobilicoccus pelagius NBRC 104925]
MRERAAGCGYRGGWQRGRPSWPRLHLTPGHAERGVTARDGASPISPTPTSTTPAAGSRVLSRPRLTATMLVLAAAVWALDQATKQWALGRFTPGEAEPFLGRLLQFTLVFNPGAAFSMGTAFTPVITVIMAAVGIGLLVASTRVGSRWWAMSAGFLLGGALGNLTDRLFRPPGFAHGHVVDFLMLPDFPVFNVADSFITTAAVCIVLAAIKDIPFGGRAADTTTEEGDHRG